MKLNKKEEEKIILEKIPLVKKLAKSLSEKYNVDIEELESYGYEALINYIRSYDGQDSMNSYIYRNVFQFMHRSIPVIAGFSQYKKLFWMYNNAVANLLKDDLEISDSEDNIKIDINMAKKIVEEIEIECDIKFDKEKENDIINYIFLKNSGHLDELYDNCDLAYLEKLSEIEENELYNNELRSVIYEVFENLEEKEKKVLIDRMGLSNKGMQTLHEIGKREDITIGKVFQVENKALQKLRYPEIAKKLNDYSDYDNYINGSNTSSSVGRVIS